MPLTWRIVDACPVDRPEDGTLCSGDRGHEPPHHADDWRNGEIVGLIEWPDQEEAPLVP